MSRPTQLWPGERMRTFFRSIFRGEAGVSDELADRLAEVCERHINRMLVWNGEPTGSSHNSKHQDTTQPPRSQEAPTPPSETDAAHEHNPAPNAVAQPASDPAEPSTPHMEPAPPEDPEATEAGAPWSTEHLEPEQPEPQETKEPATQQPAFDPFAFSAIVILARSGEDALLDRLKEIKNADNLRALANAQHLGVDVEVKNPSKLRKAIVHGAKQRLADRRAAAS